MQENAQGGRGGRSAHGKAVGREGMGPRKVSPALREVLTGQHVEFRLLVAGDRLYGGT